MRSEKNKPHKTFIGLTGGFGSGKSTVLAMLRRKAAGVVDSDAVVQSLLKSDRRVLSGIRRRFGNDVFDNTGRLDKKKVAARVFRSKKDRIYLEGLIHPLVRRAIWKKVNSVKTGVVVADIPLLYESGWDKKIDAVIVVAASKAKRISRLRDKGFSASDIRRRMKAQWPLERKMKRADFVINNNESKAQTKKQVNNLWKKIITQEGKGA